MTALVLLSYGRETEYRRAILTMLSFWGWSSDREVKMLLFTDKPEYFSPYLAGLPVEYSLVTTEMIREMKGPLNFVHRVKIAIIEKAFAQLKPQKLLYVDSDTYFQADPEPLLAQISDAISVMHMPERTFEEFTKDLANSRAAQLFINLISGRAFPTSQGPMRFRPEQQSWNAGVLGFNDSALLADVYALTEEFYQCTKWNTSEQIAFALILQSRSQLVAAAPYIFHYWPANDKKAVDSILVAKITAQLAQLPLQDRLVHARQLAMDMPTALHDYYSRNKGVALQLQAMQAFEKHQVLKGYRLSILAFVQKPGDVQFIKDVLFHAKRQLLRAAGA